jgi:hypothetical protein
MSQEIWRPVIGHENRYEVSNHGRVRSIPRLITTGIATFPGCGRVLSTIVGGRANNYHRVMLGDPKRHAYVHHLVLDAFVGPRPMDHVICHRNDNGFDNRLENLYYGTAADNLADKYRNRTPQPAELKGVPF